MVTPCPLLLSGGDVVVGDVEQPGLLEVVVATHEVFLGSHAHVGSGDGDVCIPGKVVGGIVGARAAAGRREEVGWILLLRNAHTTPSAVIHTVVVVITEGVAAGRALGVVGNGVNVRWKERAVRLMDVGGNVGPPEEGLDVRSSVVEADFEFYDASVRIQANAVHPLHPVHRFVLTEPNGHRSVFPMFDEDIGGHEGGRAVVLGPVEFDAAGRPGTGKTHESGFDDMLTVEKVIAVSLVLSYMDASADLWKHHQGNEIILDDDGVPSAIRGGFGDAVDKGKRVNATAAALINPFFQKHWIGVCGGRFVGGKYDGLSSNANFTVHFQIFAMLDQI